MQLEQLVGVAEVNPLTNSLLQESMSPQRVQAVLELVA